MYFRGNFDHALDAKHRLTIPSRFRGEFAAGIVMVPSLALEEDQASTVQIWTPAAFDAFAESSLMGQHPLLPLTQDLNRSLFNDSFDTELDSANRVMIPTQLMEHAGLRKDVTVTGSGSYLEVWDRGIYEAHREPTRTRMKSELAARLGHTA
ncbi:MAG: division/cell wall cluster transcriptional repressor MraZ [Solirubrobacteraceae bacterium]